MEWRPEPSTTNFDVKLGSDRHQTLPKRVSDDPRHFIFRPFVFEFFANFQGLFTSDDGSDWPETWPKWVSDDPQHFIFDPEAQNAFGFLLDHMIIWSYDHMIV